MNRGIPGKKSEFERVWEVQESGNLKRLTPTHKIILRKRESGYEIHVWDTLTVEHFYATRLGSPTNIYWRMWLTEYSLVPPEGINKPALFSERAAKALVLRYIQKRGLPC